MLIYVLTIGQFVISCIIGYYFYSQTKNQKSNKTTINNESRKDMLKLNALRAIKLSEPLTERARPQTIDDIIGQKNGIKALRTAMCSANPQHVIIYGPPGVGKTAAARVVLQEAIKLDASPFKAYSKFIEIDATILRFDERSIADPLIGSVHDPIYQGAGSYGPMGIPQPKQGAVTKAHGGILFIDEIGELHPIQMNKLLKVLEDRKVMLESAYYSSEDKNIPAHIHDIFTHGLPADFRLVGATTKSPDEIPEAVRSRCVEVFFEPLDNKSIIKILSKASKKLEVLAQEGVFDSICSYSHNGRDAVNILQLSASAALLENRRVISAQDVEWVAQSGKYIKKHNKKVTKGSRVGCVNGLAVGALATGTLLDIEVIATRKKNTNGSLTVTGIVEEESFERGGRKLSRVSNARCSVENVLTLMSHITDIDPYSYDIHINFPGGMPVDGPSAGVAVFCAIYSAIVQKSISNTIAMTGEISITGEILPVGGVAAKIEAAISAGVKTAFVPVSNIEERFCDYEIDVVAISHIDDLIGYVFDNKQPKTASINRINDGYDVVSASEI